MTTTEPDTIARDRATAHNDGWRAGMEHAAQRLDRLAEAFPDDREWAHAAAMLREELKITGENGA